MNCRIADLRNKQVVCLKNGCVLGFITDVELNTEKGQLEAIVIGGKLRVMGLFGKEDDIVIPWREIDVIGRETVLVTTDPAPYVRITKYKI